jgi:hypothetical protein
MDSPPAGGRDMLPVAMPHFQHLFLGSPAWLFALATIALVLHISGGTVGMVSGAGALAFPKGQSLHRLSGKVFIIAMLINAVMATTLASVLVSRGISAQWSNSSGASPPSIWWPRPG